MISKFSVKKPYTVVVAVVLIMILGFVSFQNMTVDLLPSMNLPYAVVMTTYQGASPEEVESVVTRPVEQAMATISNIKNVSSSSQENASTVILEFEQTANMDSVTLEMRETLDQISGYWPDTVGNPMIMKLNPDMMPIMVAAVSMESEDGVESTQMIEEEVIPELESLEGVASISTSGGVEKSIRVTVKQDKVAKVDHKVEQELDKKFDEAEAALDEAKSQVEEGKAQLESGQDEAAEQLSGAASEIAKKEAEVSQGKLEINEKLSEVALAEAVIAQMTSLADASEETLYSTKQQYEDLKSREDQIRSDYETVTAQIGELQQAGEEAAQEQIQELQVAQAALSVQIEMLDQYDTVMGTINEGLAQVQSQRAEVENRQSELTAAREMLEQLNAQLAQGTVSLAEARGQLSGAQLTATLQMSDASSQLAVGQAAIQSQQSQLEEAKKSAKQAADMKKVLDLTTLQGLLTAQNFNMPAGYVNEDGIDYLIRVGDKFTSVEDIKNLVLVDMEEISPIRLSDIADVEETDNSAETYAKLNGENGIMLQIQKQTGYSTGDVTDRLQERMEELEAENDQIHTTILMDQGVYIDLIVNSVLQNLMFGAVLAIIILLLFLKSIRPTFVIACSIPISILTAIVLMYFSGVTLNIISLSGLALGVGMLVDNSIVVIENIYRMRNEEGASAKEAAIAGATQVAGAITASTLTTVCVFAPIVFTQGITRQLFVDMGLTIAYSLLASLIMALTLVPMMSAGLLRKTEAKESKLFERLRGGYTKLLRRALRWKAFVLLGTLALFGISIVLALSKGTAFMPTMESTEISLTLTTEEDDTLEEAAQIADQYTEKIRQIEDIGEVGALKAAGSMMGGSSADNVIEFYALLNQNRTMSDDALQKKLEETASDLGAEANVSMSNMDMSALGSSGISVQIKGTNLDTLQQIAGEVSKIVADVDGTANVSDGMEESSEELRVVVDKTKAIQHNLTVAQVYQDLASKLRESTSSTSLELDTESLDIVVNEQENEQLTREDIKNHKLTVEKQDGTTESVALKEIADFQEATAPQAINRDAQSRYMNVTAELAPGENIGLVSDRVEKALSSYKVPDGYTLSMEGEDETINESMTELFKMLALAIVFMYLIMVAQFQSMRSPFIVMFTVPLAFTGGLLGLFLTDSPVSVIAMIGFVMLSGIIVNNGIVFVDYANQLMESGMERKEALVETGRTRLRPIIMTALTTILGLSTMALGFGQGADMVQPMAVVTIGGLIYGTVLTLVVVPCIMDLFHKREKARLTEGIKSTVDEIKEENNCD